MGCDWCELILAFRLIALLNKPVDQVDSLRAKVRTFFTNWVKAFACVALAFVLANLVANLTSVLHFWSVVAVTVLVWILLSCQGLLVIMYMSLYLAMVCVTKNIRQK